VTGILPDRCYAECRLICDDFVWIMSCCRDAGHEGDHEEILTVNWGTFRDPQFRHRHMLWKQGETEREQRSDAHGKGGAQEKP